MKAACCVIDIDLFFPPFASPSHTLIEPFFFFLKLVFFSFFFFCFFTPFLLCSTPQRVESQEGQFRPSEGTMGGQQHRSVTLQQEYVTPQVLEWTGRLETVMSSVAHLDVVADCSAGFRQQTTKWLRLVFIRASIKPPSCCCSRPSAEKAVSEISSVLVHLRHWKDKQPITVRVRGEGTHASCSGFSYNNYDTLDCHADRI